MEHEILVLANDINSLGDNKESNIEWAKKIKKLVTTEIPPINMIVNIGVIIPKLIEFLENNELPELQFEASCVLEVIASSGSIEGCKNIVDHGGIQAFIKLLSTETTTPTPICNIEKAIWCLGCIIGDPNDKYRNEMLKLNVLSLILNILNDSLNKYLKGNENTISVIKISTWTISNIIKCYPPPPFEIIKESLLILPIVLFCNDEETLGFALWSINYILMICKNQDQNENYNSIQKIIDCGICRRLVELLSFPSFSVPSLSLSVINFMLSNGNEIQIQTCLFSKLLEKFEESIIFSTTTKQINILKGICRAVSSIIVNGNQLLIQSILNANIFTLLISILETTTTTSEINLKIECFIIFSNLILNGSEIQIDQIIKLGTPLKLICEYLTPSSELEILEESIKLIESILAIDISNEYLNLIKQFTGNNNFNIQNIKKLLN